MKKIRATNPIMHKRKTNILIAESDAEIRNSLERLLESAGYQSCSATDGIAALELVAEQHFDLILLDAIMTGLDGYRVIRQLRAYPLTRKLPVIMISESREDSDELKCLETGADDCIRKPINPQLLLARIKTCLLRVAPHAYDRIEIGKFVIDCGNRSVSLGSRHIDISGAEFELLWLLASHAGKVLSRDDIFLALRGLKYDGQDRTIDMRISRLRKLLGDSSLPHKIIISVRHQGYIFSRRI